MEIAILPNLRYILKLEARLHIKCLTTDYYVLDTRYIYALNYNPKPKRVSKWVLRL